MQFHIDGFVPGDPAIADPAARLAAVSDAGAAGPLPAEVDVLIVGCGPAGLTLAAQLAAFPDIRTAIVEQKAGRLLRGQADGIACRTVEMFHAFGFSERVLKEAYWVNETAFWKPDPAAPSRIVRSGRIKDTEAGLSEFPHVILNQARVHDFYLDVMARSAARLEPQYGRRLVELVVDETAAGNPLAHAITALLERSDAAGTVLGAETVKARYVVGCDGARSAVRRSIGRNLVGDSANQAWGVMDVLAVTDFPDIRLKCLVQSAADGSVVIIPREGGYLVRIYVEMDSLAEGERIASRSITSDDIVAAANRILAPHTLQVKDIAWWSVYEIGQRLCDRFDDVPAGAPASRLPRVFIAGDACHTHSPKAGQGMNVSMQDSFNLGWKLAAVLRGRAPADLLHSYSAERQAIAAELIAFDREWAGLLSAAARAAKDPAAAPFDPAKTQDYFVRHGRYTAGTATRYAPSRLTGPGDHQHLATGLVIGTRFHSAPVIRLADAKPFQLGHCALADGRFRLYAFADAAAPDAAGSRLAALCAFLADSPVSPLRRHTRPGEDVDALIDLRAVFQQPHRDLALSSLPHLLMPRKGRLGLIDYEKAFAVDPSRDVFDLRGIDRRHGALAVVRPDQYVAAILPLDAQDELAAVFGRFLLPAA